MDYLVYILRTSKSTLYVGQTNNLEKRLLEHKAKSSKGSKYMNAFADFKLVYTEKFMSRSEAMKREYAIKQLTKKQKEELAYTK
jgi:putative endonuclease